MKKKKEYLMSEYEVIKNLIFKDLSVSANSGNNEDSERISGLRRLFFYLETEKDWLTSPASTKYHCSYETGLLEHSINVARTALRLKKILAPEIRDSSILIVGLLHDCGKCENYIMKEPTEKQKQYGYPGSIAFNSDLTYMEHEARSLLIISKFITLTDEEWAAIQYHNEPWNGTFSAFRENKTMTILQNADYWSCLYLEDGSGK